jgi:hypothetical protein
LGFLLRRYPPEDFEELARLIGRPEFATTLAHLLAELASGARRLAPGARRAERARILGELRTTDEAKYALLKSAQEKLLDKSLHARLTDLARAIESSGVPLPKKSYRRREDMVRAFVQTASRLSTDELRQAVAKLGAATSASDLESWSNIILPKTHIPDAS